MRLAAMCTATILLVSDTAWSQSAYVDDRSDAAALVHSLYNAVNRKEYARAWSYFAQPPAASLEQYAAGYADTESVEVLTGTPGEEGAAGSIYYQVPTVIDVTTTPARDRKIFAGCYIVRQSNVRETEAFTPLQIEKGAFKPVEGDPADLLPTACPDGQSLPRTDIALDKARKAFSGAYSTICNSLSQTADPAAAEPEIHAIPASSSPGEPAREYRLFRFFCDMGAYNEIHVYYLADPFGEVRPLQFTEPDLDIRYENDDHEAAVVEINITGYVATDRLVNSFYDPATLTITSYAKWRGIGDASSSGTYLFRNNRFTLVKFDVDASYDEEMNAKTVLDYATPP